MARLKKTKPSRPRKEREQTKGRKGQKSIRGVPNNSYGEIKKNITVSLTATAIAGLDRLSRQRNICRSELLEQIGRVLISLSD